MKSIRTVIGSMCVIVFLLGAYSNKLINPVYPWIFFPSLILLAAILFGFEGVIDDSPEGPM